MLKYKLNSLNLDKLKVYSKGFLSLIHTTFCACNTVKWPSLLNREQWVEAEAELRLKMVQIGVF